MFAAGPRKVSIDYRFLEESDKQIVEAAYRAYADKTDRKVWRLVNGQEVALCDSLTKKPLRIDESIMLMALNKGKMHTVNAWTRFALDMASKHEEPNEAIVKQAFDTVYRPTAGDVSYSGAKIPAFDELLTIQRKAWQAAAKAAYHENLQPTASAAAKP